MFKCRVLYISKLTVKPVLSRRNPGDPNQFLQSACLRGVAELGLGNIRRFPACQYFNGDVYHNSDDAQIKTVHWTLRALYHLSGEMAKLIANYEKGKEGKYKVKGSAIFSSYHIGLQKHRHFSFLVTFYPSHP